MNRRVVATNARLAAERQIHAAIAHFRAGNFECAVTLCSAAEGRIPKPNNPGYLFGLVTQAAPNEDFNFAATWLKHDLSPESVEIDQTMVLFWLNRAISKYRAFHGNGTLEMAALFPWAVSVSPTSA
jgi:hypothetical protein